MQGHQRFITVTFELSKCAFDSVVVRLKMLHACSIPGQVFFIENDWLY